MHNPTVNTLQEKIAGHVFAHGYISTEPLDYMQVLYLCREAVEQGYGVILLDLVYQNRNIHNNSEFCALVNTAKDITA